METGSINFNKLAVASYDIHVPYPEYPSSKNQIVAKYIYAASSGKNSKIVTR